MAYDFGNHISNDKDISVMLNELTAEYCGILENFNSNMRSLQWNMFSSACTCNYITGADSKWDVMPSLEPVWYDETYMVSRLLSLVSAARKDLEYMSLLSQIPAKYPKCLPIDRNGVVHEIIKLPPFFYSLIRSRGASKYASVNEENVYCCFVKHFTEYLKYLVWLYARHNIKEIQLGVCGMSSPKALSQDGLMFWKDVINNTLQEDTELHRYAKIIRISKTSVNYILSAFKKIVNTAPCVLKRSDIIDVFQKKEIELYEMLSFDVNYTLYEFIDECAKIAETYTGSRFL